MVPDPYRWLEAVDSPEVAQCNPCLPPDLHIPKVVKNKGPTTCLHLKVPVKQILSIA
jgi:hypothetical protein